MKTDKFEYLRRITRNHTSISEQLQCLQSELKRVILDVEYGDGFDEVCYNTIIRVYNELNNLSQQTKGY
jgi:hypothetical protein